MPPSTIASPSLASLIASDKKVTKNGRRFRRRRATVCWRRAIDVLLIEEDQADAVDYAAWHATFRRHGLVRVWRASDILPGYVFLCCQLALDVILRALATHPMTCLGMWL